MQKQAWTILFSIFFVLFIAGCGVAQQPIPSKSKDFDVTMDVQHTFSDDGTLTCNITTNLPNQTSLDVSINSGPYGSTTTSVEDGIVTATFKYLKPGPYTVSIKTSAYPGHSDTLNQLNSVSDVIGYTGGNMKGPYVAEIGSNAHGISYTKDITVGSKEQIAAAQTPAPTLTEAEKEEFMMISQLNWNNGPHHLTSNGITYEIARTSLPIDKRAGTGVRYEEVISKIDFRLPLEKRVRTIISSRVIN